MKIRKIIKPGLFLVILLSLFLAVNSVMVNPSTSDRLYQTIKGFYEEKDDSLDIVYIGASTSYAFFSPMTAYNNFGITSYLYGAACLPAKAYKYFIEEARKTQPDALYVLTFTTFNNDDSIYSKHRSVDFLNWSETKYNLIQELADNEEEYEEMMFPMLRFHGRWGDLLYTDLNRKLDGTKNGMRYVSYFKSKSFEGYSFETDDYLPLDEDFVETVQELIDYCKENNVRFCVVFPPRCAEEYELYASQNTLKELLEEEGVDVFDCRQSWEETGIDVSIDFYDEHHTNIHGSIKYTNYMVPQLMEKYGIKARSDSKLIAEWDTAYEKYLKKIKKGYFDFEWDHSARDCSLEIPAPLELSYEDGKVTFTWEKTEDCDGYAVYRRVDEVWQKIATTTDTTYTDVVEDGDGYVYTAVPYVIVDGKMVYGDFSYKGLTLSLDNVVETDDDIDTEGEE